MVKAAASLILLMLTAPFGTETVEVRDRGPVDLAGFECRDIRRSTIIQRACYDRAQRQLIVATKG
ncbi:MAG: KTSC domain-containing protein, partial [bacterium]|nr:KTSC domain-containing protein [bacterium]